jgi:hypothetical protein
VSTGHDYSPPGKPKIDWDGPAAKETLMSGLIGTLVPGACWMIPPGMSTFE